MNHYIIDVRNVNKEIKRHLIINGVSFSIREGSITGLLGPNGAGKTTIIRLLNGVIAASGGEIAVMGFNPIEEGDEIRKRAGIVTESASLYHDMSAWENLVFFAKIYGNYDDKRIIYLLDQFDLLSVKDQLVGTFSTGMKKRLSVAKALLHQPKLLFLDEPTNGLDPDGINSVIFYLNKLNKEENVTILICSHVLHQLENICDSYLVLNKGQIIEAGTKNELEDKYLGSIRLLVETGLTAQGKTYMGYSYERKGPLQVEFLLPSKREIAPLLRQILQETWIHSSEITNRSLESLYFKIVGERDE
ncbi:ABC transporter ATP-binding protein [Bacillus sp. CECT 9360]|uniref:ABC transporter ATP-binding protein n=1 Tax=Bacillus sp. CECT 9360 TaxID=2845821 RepID=UPI001E370877|nr:ABC transporter ATP-binding protein [Bacillus sp. CECT 9360]CAH0344504.1 Vitamin B12 import ATP-binding protein BtuD [Bacillus sp. CECT 9360]